MVHEAAPFLSEVVPSGHAEHAVEPTLLVYSPGLHGAHPVPVPLADVPGPHQVQEVARVAPGVWPDPPGQLRLHPAPMVSPYLPGGHAPHESRLVAPGLIPVPRLQAPHEEAPELPDHFPGTQVSQVALLLAPVLVEKVPGTHWLHVVWPPEVE